MARTADQQAAWDRLRGDATTVAAQQARREATGAPVTEVATSADTGRISVTVSGVGNVIEARETARSVFAAHGRTMDEDGRSYPADAHRPRHYVFGESRVGMGAHVAGIL